MKATKVASNVFRDYLKDRKIDEDSLVASKDKLATVLRKFYAEARKMNGLPLPPKIENKLGDRMLKQLLNSVIVKYRDLSMSPASANN